MNRYFLFLVLFVLCVSCKPKVYKDSEVNNVWVLGNITHFEYNEHKYIKFEEGYRAGVVDDPACEACREMRKQEMIEVLKELNK